MRRTSRWPTSSRATRRHAASAGGRARACLYSNPGYGVAGYVLEQVTGRPYDSVIRERIFDPLGMRTSSFTLTEDDLPLLASGYDSPTGPPVPFTQIYLRPAGNLHTSAARARRLRADAAQLGRDCRASS